MKTAMHLALRYLAGRKLRTALTTLAVVFGVFVFFGMNAVLPSVMATFQHNVQSAWGQVDATITHQSGEAFPASVGAKLSAFPGVRVVSGFLSRPVNLPPSLYPAAKGRRIPSAVSLVGIAPKEAAQIRTYTLEEGRFLTDADAGHAVITASLAHALGLALGSSFALPTPSGMARLAVVGIRPARSSPGNEEVLIPLREAGRLFGSPDRVSALEVNFDTFDATRRESLHAGLRAGLGDEYKIGSPATGTELFATLKLGMYAINLFGLVAMAMGAFIILNTYRTVVAERRRDLGMLRALGADGRTLLAVLLIEGFLQGLAGTLVGLAVGWGFAAALLAGLSGIMESFMHVRTGGPVVSPLLVGITAVLGIGMTLLAAGIPARQALRISPLEALRPVEGKTAASRPGKGFWAGVLLLLFASAAVWNPSAAVSLCGGAAFLLALLLLAPTLVRPITALFGGLLSRTIARDGVGRLAQGQLARQPSRSAVTASTTLLALALLVATGSVMTSITEHFLGMLKATLASDYLLIPPTVSVWASDVGAKPELAEKIRALPEVSLVSTLRFASASLSSRPSMGKELSGDTPVSVLGIDPASFPKVSALRFESGNARLAYPALASGRNLILNGSAASTTKLHPGDRAVLVTARGLREYRVVAIGNDYLNAKLVTAYVSQENLREDFGKIEDVFLQFNLKPGADAARAEMGVRTLLEDYPQFRLTRSQKYLADNLATFYSAFGALYLLFIILAVPSLLALVNTLAIGVFERTRELGMLRAIGATRGQVRLLVLAEAMLLSSLGALLGLAAGGVVGRVLVSNAEHLGFTLEYSFPYVWMLASIAIAVAFGALAAYFPGRRAARMQIVEALRHEG
ncbi:MAG: FtsX-like permease family protein [Spirochaetes bacterium]|nr:FtsX-like permease family protein [Spirochaetota bacterium]